MQDPLLRGLVVQRISQNPAYEALAASTNDEALHIAAQRQRIGLIIAESRTEIAQALNLLHALRELPSGHTTPMVLLTNFTSRLDRNAAERASVGAIVELPLAWAEFDEQVERLSSISMEGR